MPGGPGSPLKDVGKTINHPIFDGLYP
jgi:hypothetical protein